MTEEYGNALEKALQLAAHEEASRPAFYKILLESSVYVIGHTDGPTGEAKVFQPGEELTIDNWQGSDGREIIPFFSSLNALKKGIEHEVEYLELPARALFEITSGSTLVLNPRLDYGKEFSPREISALLSGETPNLIERREIKEQTRVRIGQPANYPFKMVASLRSFFITRTNVKAAYLALMHNPSLDDKPHLIVGIEADGDVEEILREAGTMIGGTVPDGDPVDMLNIKRGEPGVSQYFLKNVNPFYKRSLGIKLKSLFTSGHA